jgi:REP element-mobilizing transposase RayT
MWPKYIQHGVNQQRLSLVSKQLNCPPLLVVGVEDHVHLFARFGRTVTQAKWVKELKRISSLWLKDRATDSVLLLSLGLLRLVLRTQSRSVPDSRC